MDAKPQRPVRPVRAYGDENIPPIIDGNKALHQRYKSTSALGTMVAVGGPNVAGLKGPAKRTAFGDVSNTAKNIQTTTKDDASMAIKGGIQPVEKPLQQEKKASAGLLRPAQRPLSVSGLKGLLNNAAAGMTSSITTSKSKQATNENDNAAPLANSRKLLTKRHPIVFKDQSAEEEDASNVQLIKPSRSSHSVPPVKQSLVPRHYKSQPQIRPEQVVVKRIEDDVVQESCSVEEKQGPPLNLSTSSDKVDEELAIASIAIKTDPIEDEAGQLDHPEVGSTLFEHKLPPGEGLAQQEYNLSAIEHYGDIEEKALLQIQEALLPQQPMISEPDAYPSYSEEEDEEEWVDDEGYTTARSYKSRGENATGGGTTVLFPKVTARVRRELAAAKSIVEGSILTAELEDDLYDTSMVAEYGPEIFSYMRELEMKMLPNPHYMDNQAEIQWSMRSVLMDWLVQVHLRFLLLPETLFLCVNYIDRFLSCKIVSLGKLQLVGATAIFIAAKYEEINCPSVQDIHYMVDSGYTIDEILKAERFMLSMLQFELGWPGPMSFLRRISKADDYDLETRTLAKYFLEVTIMDERFVGCPPSYVAAGSHCLARLMLKKGDWSPAHVYYSNYTWSQLRPLVTMMLECCENPQKHHAAVFEKYIDKRYKKASLFVEEQIQNGFHLSDNASGNKQRLPYCS